MSALSLSSNEFCILNLLWAESRAMTRPEILEALPDKDWNPNSIHLILNNMIKKGVLQVEGVARCGRGYGRTYAPTLSQTEYAAAQALDATPDMTVSDRLLGVVAALVDKKGIDEQTIAELEQMLEEKRKELMPDGLK